MDRSSSPVGPLLSETDRYVLEGLRGGGGGKGGGEQGGHMKRLISMQRPTDKKIIGSSKNEMLGTGIKFLVRGGKKVTSEKNRYLKNRQKKGTLRVV